MEFKATRTLVKSQPELWELLDDEPQLRHWNERLGEPGGELVVTAHEPGQRLAWRSPGGGSVEVTLAEKGFGTQVVIAARAEGEAVPDVLEHMLDDLAEPQRRPFSAV